MNIRNRRELKQFAAGRLENARNLKQVVWLYVGLTLGLSALATVVSYVLELQIDNLGGLRNFSTKTLLSTVQTMLPIAVQIVTMCVSLGYQSVMLRYARGQFASPNGLRLGFDRFWQLLRCSLFQTFRYAALLLMSIYLGVLIFMSTPLGDAAMEILAPAMAETSVLDGQIVLSDAAYAEFSASVWPAYLICGGLFALLAVPLWYSYRLVNYLIIEKPGMGALMLLRQSVQMMRKNRLALFKVDVSLWWYYLLLALAQVLCYGDVILPLVGISLPGNPDVWYFVFVAAYLLAVALITVLLRSRVEVIYALAYDSLKPEEKQDNGVVLGNIFQS